MLALIDADILLYEIGSYTDDEGHPLSWPLCKSRADAKIIKIMEAAGCDDYHLYLTGENNFRIKEGTIKPYKGHRVSPKPANYANLKKYFSTSTNFAGKVTITDGYEADDELSIQQCSMYHRQLDGDFAYMHSIEVLYGETVLCSRDKDLDMVPGWHYSWKSGDQKERPLWFITQSEGYRWFFRQLLTGDSTDNILGLHGIAGKAQCVKDVMKMTDIADMYKRVQHQYELRFGSYWKMFMHENARLLWMLRHKDDDVREWLDELEEARKQKLSLESTEF